MEQAVVVTQRSIVNDLVEIFSAKTIDFENDPIIKAFEEADKTFQKLIEDGLTKRRGYTLMTIEDARLQSLNFTSNLTSNGIPSLSL